VPISAIVFGGRRSSLMPLVLEARDWTHGVRVGAAMGSETTAAATGQVGVMRRDPMAMKPFCGYHFGDYFAHWLSFDRPGAKLPKIFHVNWFRKDADGRFLWPGFGENMRVLEWVVGRITGNAAVVASPAGWLPDVAQAPGLVPAGISRSALQVLTSIDPGEWATEMEEIDRHLAGIGTRVPPAVSQSGPV